MKQLVKVTVDDEEFPFIVRGYITRKLDKSATLNLTLPSWKKIGLDNFYPGAVIKVYLGIGVLDSTPAFEGVYTESSYDLSSTSHAQTIICYDRAHLAGSVGEKIYLDKYTNYDGEECTAVIEEVLENAETGLSLDGIKPTNPSCYIKEEHNIRGSMSPIDVIKKVLDAKIAYDDSNYPDSPLLYHWLVKGDTFHIIKEKNIETATPQYTLEVGRNIEKINVRKTLNKIITACTVIGGEYTEKGVTKNYKFTYRDKSSSRIYYGSTSGSMGRHKVIEDSDITDGSADCEELAVRMVEHDKFAAYSERIDWYGLYTFHPMDIIELKGVGDKDDGNRQINDISINFGINSFSCTATLSMTRPMLV